MRHEYTTDEARAWLLAGLKYQRILSALERKYNAIEERLPDARLSKLTGMPRGGAHDWQTDVDKLIDERRELAAKIRLTMARIKARREVINTIDAPHTRAVIAAYYLDGLTTGQVTRKLKRTQQTVYQQHQRGLALVAWELTRRAENAPYPGTDAAALWGCGE
ncbi:MAG: hypothetical protein IKU14_00965 [Rhodocyclaceae bacterium]|nr:hypothetical protein [Rhodocyclaceae bacterium]